MLFLFFYHKSYENRLVYLRRIFTVRNFKQKRKTGARGLRAIMEKIMMDTMYQVPSDETIKECRITRDVVEGKGEPLYLRDGEERRSFLTSQSA